MSHQKPTTTVTRFLIKTENQTSPSRLCNILALKDPSCQVYEYKIAFPGHSGFKMMKVGAFDATRGLIKRGETNWGSDNIEVCYHSKGWLTYKDVERGKKNHKPHRWRARPFDKIAAAEPFLRLCFTGSNALLPYTKNPEFVFDLPWSQHQPFSVDFILCNSATKFLMPKKFVDTQQFILKDEDTGLFLTLCFYRSENRDGNFLIMLPRPLWAVLRDHFYETILDLKMMIKRYF